MMTRGRRGNHVYLGVVGDEVPLGDPPSCSTRAHRPMCSADPRHNAPRSRPPRCSADAAAHPAVRLGHATATYTDALYIVAAEQTLGSDVVAGLDDAVGGVIPGSAADRHGPLCEHICCSVMVYVLLGSVASVEDLA